VEDLDCSRYSFTPGEANALEGSRGGRGFRSSCKHPRISSPSNDGEGLENTVTLNNSMDECSVESNFNKDDS
jgi:hypothetical protein